MPDGGIRHGTDTLNKIGLWATGVSAAPVHLWGLTNSGTVGLKHALTLLQDELDMAIAISG